MATPRGAASRKSSSTSSPRRSSNPGAGANGTSRSSARRTRSRRIGTAKCRPSYKSYNAASLPGENLKNEQEIQHGGGTRCLCAVGDERARGPGEACGQTGDTRPPGRSCGAGEIRSAYPRPGGAEDGQGRHQAADG